MVAAVGAKDMKRLRELSQEHGTATRHWAAEEVRVLQAEKESLMLPIRDQFLRIIDRTEGLADKIEALGGVLSFSYTKKEGQPVTSINIGSQAVAAARAPREGGTARTPGAGQRSFLVNGSSMGLGEAFDAVATDEEKAEKATRVETAKAKGSRSDAVAWQYHNQVVQKAIKAGTIQVVEGNGS